jgi:hypothetical protein
MCGCVCVFARLQACVHTQQDRSTRSSLATCCPRHSVRIVRGDICNETSSNPFPGKSKLRLLKLFFICRGIYYITNSFCKYQLKQLHPSPCCKLRFYHFNLTSTRSFVNSTGKAIPLQALTGPEGSRRLRLPGT